MKRKLLATLLCLCMALTLLPTTGLADETYTMDFSKTTPVSWGTEVLNVNFSTTDATGTNWSWVANTKTLTLDGLAFTTSAATAIELPGGATLVLSDGTTNTVTSTYNGTSESYGIEVPRGGLTVRGGGTLTATAATSTVKNVQASAWPCSMRARPPSRIAAGSQATAARPRARTQGATAW